MFNHFKYAHEVCPLMALKQDNHPESLFFVEHVSDRREASESWALLCLCLHCPGWGFRVHMASIRPSPTSSHCFEKHCTHPSLIPSESVTIKLDQIFSETCSLSPLLRWNFVFSSLYSLCVLFSSDFVTVTLFLRFGDITVTARDFTFYDCTAVKQLSGSMPWVSTNDLSALLSLILQIYPSLFTPCCFPFCFVSWSFFVPPTLHLIPTCSPGFHSSLQTFDLKL